MLRTTPKNGNYYLVEAIPDTNKRTVEVVSAYKKKANQAADVQAPTSNVRNAPDSTFKSSIAKGNNIVNRSTQIRHVDNPDLNGFIEYLNDFANDLAGKTGGLDRAVIKSMGNSGRTAIKALQFQNACSSIMVTLFPIVKLVIPSQPSKAPSIMNIAVILIKVFVDNAIDTW